MELLNIIAAFFVAFSFMLVPCASNQVNVQKSREVHDHPAKFSTLTLLPRKLKINEDQANVMKSSAEKYFMMTTKKSIEPSSVTKLHEREKNVIHAAEKGTSGWINNEEGPNKSEYFSMDYGWVRKRRPIHNK